MFVVAAYKKRRKLRVRYSCLVPLVLFLVGCVYYVTATFTGWEERDVDNRETMKHHRRYGDNKNSGNSDDNGHLIRNIDVNQQFMSDSAGVSEDDVVPSHRVNKTVKSNMYVLNEPSFCSTGAPFLLILVTSAPKNVDRRGAIRATWGHNNNSDDIRVLFLLGAVKDKKLQKQILHESVRHNDIIQGSFQDAYYNLTLKTVMGLKWTAEFCGDVRFVMKTDDDMFVNVPYLVEFLMESKIKKKIIGCNKQLSAPQPINTDGLLPPPGHPPFVAGAGYVIPGDVVPLLVSASQRVTLIPVEDVYVTAYLGGEAGIGAPLNVPGFSCGEAVMDECELTTRFTGHRVTPEMMYNIWEKFTSEPNPCMDF